ncbi:MAG TPA: (Fe-S)-binding protein [Fimbriimonadaceae bacterium]|nr:(Fe-S)-binding protein [Fimbriimonadaceae bacterium]
MTVKLMLTCLCDAFYGEVGIATVRVLEHAGCTVQFPKGQTCCGQPPYNAGDWEASRTVAAHWKQVFGDDGTPIVTPSSSCAAMIREGYAQLFGEHRDYPVYELSEFFVKRLGLNRWPLAHSAGTLLQQKIAYHRSCHGRGIGLTNEQETLLRAVPGVEFHSIDQIEQCCGFGGAFCVGHPTISAGIGSEKLRHVAETGASILVGGDMGCLMHLRGLIEKQGLGLETRHFAEILADAIPAPVPA